MTEAHGLAARKTQMVRILGVVYGVGVNDRPLAMRIHDRLHSAQYRREREHSEWVDFGGEGG